MHSPETEAPGPDIHCGQASRADVDGIEDLIRLRPPAYWMRKIPAAGLRDFLDYALRSPHAVILAARTRNDAPPAGYVFAITDSIRFWAGFSLRSPFLAGAIVYHRLARLRELRRRNQARAGRAGLPRFSWSPSRLGYARIIGLYVRAEHHHKGVAMDLYFLLFEVLKERGCPRVEEYAAPDYAEFAGKFPKVCGWSLQACDCGGYKISRAL
jgi:hypothetical protein